MLQDIADLRGFCCRASAFALEHHATTMEQSAPPVDIHAPFTRAERMQQLADIDHVSNRLPRQRPLELLATC